MALEVRRIVTGHDSRGRAVVATDERRLRQEYRWSMAYRVNMQSRRPSLLKLDQLL